MSGRSAIVVAMDSSAISVSGLRKAYRDKTVLDGIDLEVSVDDLLTGRENLLMMVDLRHLARAEGRRITERLGGSSPSRSGSVSPKDS
jgi:hypothetical protein